MTKVLRLRSDFLWVAILLAITPNAYANWSLDSAGLSGECALVSPIVTIDDGHGNTQVQLKLNNNRMLIITDSNIDNSMNDLGLRVDDKAFLGISEVVNTTHVSFEQDRIDEIIKQFVPGRRVFVHLRFWPTWPSTGIKTVEFSLIGFTRAFKALPQC